MSRSMTKTLTITDRRSLHHRKTRWRISRYRPLKKWLPFLHHLNNKKKSTKTSCPWRRTRTTKSITKRNRWLSKNRQRSKRQNRRRLSPSMARSFKSKSRWRLMLRMRLHQLFYKKTLKWRRRPKSHQQAPTTCQLKSSKSQRKRWRKTTWLSSRKFRHFLRVRRYTQLCNRRYKSVKNWRSFTK